LKKVILHNSSEIQSEVLSQFVIQKLEQGYVFTFKKVKKAVIESYEYEEEYESDIPRWKDRIIEKDYFERKEKRDKLIRNYRCYSYLRDSSNLFTKEEKEMLSDPFIEILSEENFQLLLNKYRTYDSQLKETQINEDIKAMTSSIIETQECI
jgi:hypothetical protein